MTPVQEKLLQLRGGNTGGTATASPAANTVAAKLAQIRAANAPAPTPPPPTLGQKILGAAKGETSFPAQAGGAETIIPNIKRTFGNIPSDAAGIARAAIAPVNPLDTNAPTNIGANIVKGAGVLGDIFKNRGIVKGTGDVVSALQETPWNLDKAGADFVVGEAKKAIADPGKYATDVTTKASEGLINHPLFIPSLIYGSGAKPVFPALDEATSIPNIAGNVADAAGAMASKLTQRSESQIEGAIVDKFQKGVKPLIGARQTAAGAEKYKSDIVTGAKAIQENAPNLSFITDFGEVIVGKIPQSLQQLSDALEQTKRSIFQKYDALAKTAGDAGVTIDVGDISKELSAVTGNKALQLTNPKAVKYAEELQQRLLATGSLDATTAQDVIQNYNKSLEAFYRNPTYDTASQAAIDAMVANKMREALDAGVSSITGEEYGALKSQYGALKNIERDVVKAALRDARKNTKGLIDLTDVFSGGQVVNGILSMNPATIGQGITAKAIAAFYKYLNDPNRAIKGLFENVSKLPEAAAAPKVPFLQLPPGDAGASTINNGRPIPVFPAGTRDITSPETAVAPYTPAAAPGTETPTPSVPLLPAPGESAIALPAKTVPPKLDQAASDAAYGQGLKDKAAAPAMDVVGKAAADPLSVAEQHISSAKQILANLQPNEIQHLGGMSELLKRTKTNIVDGLKAEGFTEEAGYLNALDIKHFPTIDKLDEAVKRVFEIMKPVPKDPIPPELLNIPKDTSLTGQDAAVQDASIQKVQTGKAALLAQYLKENGNIVNTDNARKLFTDVGYNGNNSAAVHEASSHISTAAFTHLIESKDPGAAYFLAGGSGAGKSTATREFAKAIEDASVVLDGNLSSYKSSSQKIKAAEAAGHTPAVLYVYRDPMEAWKNGVIKRMVGTGSDAGRVVPLKVFLENTVGSLQVVKKLLDDGIPVFGFKTNENAAGSKLTTDEIKKLDYGPTLQEDLTKQTEQMAAVGAIGEDQYNALMQGLSHTPFSKLRK